jgi:phosphinothricin acetyltransferase
MAEPLTLRPYRQADAAALAVIYAHYVRTSTATFDFEPPPVGVIAEKFGAIADRGHPLVIGEVAGEIAGFAYASDYRPRPGYRFTCEDSIYLAPAHCGHGFGSVLLAEIIDKARAFGFAQMLAVITADMTVSIRLHEKFGFETRGTYPAIGHKFDRWLDIVHMQKAL